MKFFQLNKYFPHRNLSKLPSLKRVTLFTLSSIALSSCSTNSSNIIGQTLNEGYVFEKEALDFTPIGSSMDQILMVMGSPSMRSLTGPKIFYYISQQRHRAAAFLKPNIVSRRVVAFYFDNKDKVAKIANYGLKDGKVFDFVSRTTPTTGTDQNFLQEILSNTTFVPVNLKK